MGLWSKQAIILVVSIFTAIILLMTVLFEQEMKRAINNELTHYEFFIDNKIKSLIAKQERLTEVAAISLSASNDIQQLLNKKPQEVAKELKRIAAHLQQYPYYKDIWLKLIDKNGISLGRSLDGLHGENLAKTRLNVASVINDPRQLNSLKADEISLSFKTISPIFDQNKQFIGILSVILPIDTINNPLQAIKGLRTVILINESYQPQSPQIDTNRFITDNYHHIANTIYNPQDIGIITELGVHNMFTKGMFIKHNDIIITSTVIPDINGNPMVSWVTLKSLYQFDFTNINEIRNQTILIFIGILLLLSLLMMVYLKHKTKIEKNFFKQFFENSTEEICIFDNKKIIEANQNFLSLFKNSKTITNFYKEYDFFEDIFVIEQFNDQFKKADLLEFLLQSKDGYKLKINTVNGVETFIIKATKITGMLGEKHTMLLMTNISQEILYRKKLEKLVITDELTGINNRHYFNNQLVADIQYAKRYKSSFALVIIDIDYFKKINDTYGHDIGDVVLIELTKCINNNLRETDKFCRIGGEEFAITLLNTDLAGSMIFAEKMRLAVENIPTNLIPKKITISLGIAIFQHQDTFKSIYKRADNALYKAKENGRNRIETDEKETT